jgi:hypothetical protein
VGHISYGTAPERDLLLRDGRIGKCGGLSAKLGYYYHFYGIINESENAKKLPQAARRCTKALVTYLLRSLQPQILVDRHWPMPSACNTRSNQFFTEEAVIFCQLAAVSQSNDALHRLR